MTLSVQGVAGHRFDDIEAAGVAILIGGGPMAAYCTLHLMDELNL